MEIVEMRSDEITAVKKLFLEVFSAEPWNDHWKSDEELTQYIRELTQNPNSLSLMLIDDYENIVAASLGYVFSWWQGKDYFIKEFFVCGESQGKGIGSEFLVLMDDFLLAREIKSIWLMTERTVPAYRFYLKNGFTEAEDIVFFQKSVKKSH
ncbi:GNAT family N-acetyltransferase [Mesotoga sp. B105.6.4]|uniref:GNAT family N-acetyltransferase n=1 Tax=Mesotoga sp. B105.6.4 TaxID=1582224 RepID=UPI000CCC0FF5|nr:GNAT family N-acetyltransferase [Mesotoga sp. B105.6.4]PNS42183.1 hypothetical protein RJ60_04035 [Mesotoga sp. B105.6.4]